jgi:hypothetical protein
MTTPEKIALGAAAVSLATMLSTVAFALINYRRERLNQRIQFAKVQQDYFATLRAWADQASSQLSEAIHFAELDPQRLPDGAFFERRHRIRIALSSFIDRGRWFFPNLHTDKHGQEKEGAFRGYRQQVLNGLVAAYDAVTDLDYMVAANNPPRRRELVAATRCFVTEIQAILDPAIRDNEFKKITHAVTGANVA